ncbi:glycosyltransferase [Rhodoblastus acidophilus]|uniref:Glycosyltransferase n=1 Tax=Rhodoblastus acidophilus TaxID=1074 RepID=A0A6N8DLP8_RHOAC|nr:glycosyltransferase family 4 protein [Rhodoblastus acidophilus]MCW2273205.1 mannosyltransferase [Rhodoblastus acidophilus]MTV30101.1 glycosyltransferase [Rhodoblastus acidophilus]
MSKRRKSPASSLALTTADPLSPLADTSDLRQLLAVTPNLHWRYSGVTSTILALAPYAARQGRVACVGAHLPAETPQIPFRQMFLYGWSRPPRGSHRIFHARRNNEMIVGLLLKHVLRQPWKIVFTWAGQRRQSRFTRWMLRRIDGVIATSEASASYLEVPCVVIHHGVDVRRFQPLADRTAEWGQSGLPGKFGVGAFGRIRAQKGTDVLIDAALRLLPKYPDATLLLTGLVTPDNADFVAGLKEKIAQAGLEQRILFLGEQPREKMPFWFALVSVYVAPMRWEGFGLTPLEAMACGTAVVATRTGAAAQLVAEGETGFLIPPGDVDALSAALEPLLADPERASQMGALGREKALAQHDIAREAASIQAFYEKILGVSLSRV